MPASVVGWGRGIVQALRRDEPRNRCATAGYLDIAYGFFVVRALGGLGADEGQIVASDRSLLAGLHEQDLFALVGTRADNAEQHEADAEVRETGAIGRAVEIAEPRSVSSKPPDLPSRGRGFRKWRPP